VATEAGQVYLKVHDFPSALSEFGRALALEPRSAAALSNRGAALLALGQSDAARQDFERALAIDECQPEARANLARLGINRPAPAGCR
jgi:Flp pilus assembly protein TadD